MLILIIKGGLFALLLVLAAVWDIPVSYTHLNTIIFYIIAESIWQIKDLVLYYYA